MYMIQELTSSGFQKVADSKLISEAKAIMAALIDFRAMEIEQNAGAEKCTYYIRVVEYTERGILIIEESAGEVIEAECMQ